MEAIHTEKHGKYTIKIFHDPDSPNPRVDYDHLGTIYHIDHFSDLGVFKSMEFIEELNSSEFYVSLPVYFHKFNSPMLKTGPLRDTWSHADRQVGIITVSKDKVLKEWKRKKWTKKLELQVIKLLRSEIAEFSNYLSGEVYGYTIEEETGCDKCGNIEFEHVDSCWGFIGTFEYCLAEALNNLPKERAA